MSPRRISLLAVTRICSQAGLIGSSALIAIVRWLAKGNLSVSMLMVLMKAALLTIESKPGIIRRIVIGQALRYLATKALLLYSIGDTTKHLAPEQMANGILADMDSIMNDCWMLVNPLCQKYDYNYI